MLKLQIMSDLHLEMDAQFTVTSRAEHLVLCGDIGQPGTSVYEDFLLAQADQFAKVFVVAGNHECYGSNVQDTLEAIDAVCARRPDQLIHLNKNAYDYRGYRFLGVTLWSALDDWSDLSDIRNAVADFRLIENMSTWAYNRRHSEDAHWLDESLHACELEGKEAIVLTHHAPSHKGTIHPRYAGSSLTEAFATNMEHLMGSTVPLWCFGHTHYRSDQVIRGTRVVSNPRGYYGEVPTFDRDFVVTV